ncbi:MAG: threonylcarbamoyl-AMP synthase [Gammaproteobacteria bacterium]|nr:threonylcarbamoyl-AMP synthase [Gammaproteobacteria bacterium]
MQEKRNIQIEIQQAVNILREGGLVAFPTETVYGLGADAKNPEALAKIFSAKKRPKDHPLIVHLADRQQLKDWVREIPSVAEQLADAFWPGPLTLIFKKNAQVSDKITGGQNTIGIRFPHHPIAVALLQQFGSGLAAPSANRFGRISPTTADAVHEELDAAVDMILDGGQCDVGVESTIVDVSNGTPVILRPGMISKTAIEAVLKQMLGEPLQHIPRVSGSHQSHYAPMTLTQLIETKQIPSFVEKIDANDLPMAFLLVKTKLLPREGIDYIAMSTDPLLYAHDLYFIMRELDKKHYKKIIIESVPINSEWDGIRDRLKRASRGFVGI